MVKKSGGGRKSAPKETKTTADHHRKMAGELSAKARIHSAKADLLDAQDPKKKPYPYC